MSDLALLDKVAYWISFAHIASVCLTILTSVVVVFLSHQRAALRDVELKKVQVQAEERIATAIEQFAEANRRFVTSNAAAAEAQAKAAAATPPEAQLRVTSTSNT